MIKLLRRLKFSWKVLTSKSYFLVLITKDHQSIRVFEINQIADVFIITDQVGENMSQLQVKTEAESIYNGWI